MHRIIHQSLRALARRFRGDVCGATGTEYAVLLAVVIAVVAVTVGALGRNVSGTTESISRGLSGESGMTFVVAASRQLAP